MTVGLLPSPTDEQVMLVDASVRLIEAELPVRSPDFAMMSPLSIAVRGRVRCGSIGAPIFI